MITKNSLVILRLTEQALEAPFSLMEGASIKVFGKSQSFQSPEKKTCISEWTRYLLFYRPWPIRLKEMLRVEKSAVNSLMCVHWFTVPCSVQCSASSVPQAKD
jgi:hypothetical protein